MNTEQLKGEERTKPTRGVLPSVLLLRCPCCHEGHLYVNKSPYTWVRIGEMNTTCSVCGADLRNETGFYFGAAYVSYALTVMLWISILVALIVFNAIGLIEFRFFEHPIFFLTIGLSATVVLFPYLFRLSRSIWAHFFIREKKSS